MRDRTITISSAAKTFSITGWKIGWALAPPEATTAIRRIHQFSAFAVSTPFQHGVAAGIRAHHQLVPPLVEDLRVQRDRLCTGLEEAGMRPRVPEGTFFVIADFSALSNRQDVDYVIDLIESKASIATIPLSVFYPDQDNAFHNYIRFCFAKRPESIDRGLERLHVLRG
jgi:N-succinyldiaminopimelate aminotransferase